MFSCKYLNIEFYLSNYSILFDYGDLSNQFISYIFIIITILQLIFYSLFKLILNNAIYQFYVFCIKILNNKFI